MSSETHTLRLLLEHAVELRILIHSATETKLIWKHVQRDTIRATEITTHVAARYDRYELATLELDFWVKVDTGEPQWTPYNFGFRYKVDPANADMLVSDDIDLGRFGVAPNASPSAITPAFVGRFGRRLQDYLTLRREHGFYNIVFQCFDREITIAVPATF